MRQAGRARAVELDDAAHLAQQRQPRGLDAQHVDDLHQVVAHGARRVHLRVAQHLPRTQPEAGRIARQARNLGGYYQALQKASFSHCIAISGGYTCIY